MDKVLFRSNRVNKIKLDFLNKLLLDLEKSITYPLGSVDRFTISHGSDYFRFFNRLGIPHWALLIESERICSQLCAILRKVPSKLGTLQKAWYLCDLKKDKKNGPHDGFSTLFRQILRLLWKCQRGYAISMNEPDNSNRLIHLVEKIVFLPLSQTKLEIFSCSYEELSHFLPIINEYRGETSYLSLEGIKDIILQKTGKLPLIHLQFGPLKDESSSIVNPIQGYKYMWCAPVKDPLREALIASGCAPTASATIFSFRMKNNDWSWVLTSDI